MLADGSRAIEHLPPEWLNADLCPPGCFVAITMKFTMMSTAQWDREFITHLSPECSALSKSQVVGSAGRVRN